MIPPIKKKTWKASGSASPFFDRFEGMTFMEENHLTSLTFYNREETIDSIVRNVNAIFNTRATLTASDYKKLDAAKLTYGYPDLFGLPDFSFFSPADSSTWSKSSCFMDTALRLFEPRLTHARTTIQSFDASTQTLLVTIQADVMMGSIVERMNFPIAVYNVPYNKVQHIA